MTPDLQPIWDRLERATPTPWCRDYLHVFSEPVTSHTSHKIATYCWSVADADLIAHAPADLAAPCDEVERLRENLNAMTIDVPDTAVEAAVQAIRDSLQFPDSAPADAWPRIAKIALTAAAPLIAEQATADLHARVKALAGEWRSKADGIITAAIDRVQDGNDPEIPGIAQAVGLLRLQADALDALGGGA